MQVDENKVVDKKWPVGFESVPKILLVDDEPNVLNSIRRLLYSLKYDLTLTNNAEEALEKIKNDEYDLVISDMRMPGMDGAHFLGYVQEHFPETIRILLSGYSDFNSTVTAINIGNIYRYHSKPWKDEELLLTIKQGLEQRGFYKEHIRLKRLIEEQNQELKMNNVLLEERVHHRTEALEHAHEKLKRSFMMSIKIFTHLIEMRSDINATNPVRGHTKRVADLARKMAEKMALPRGVSQDIMLAGLLHDIGKIGFSDALISKPFCQFSDDELVLLKTHPIKGADALAPLEELNSAALILKFQHERYDGYGFPEGLSGEAIPLGARILSVAIDYDAVQLGLRLNQKLSRAEAKDWIFKGKATRYDPGCVDVLMQILDEHAQAKIPYRQLTSAELQEGMVLAHDILLADGVVLLEAGYVLDALWIRKIRSLEKSANTVFCIQVNM